KSLGNFFTLRDLLAKGFTGREVRYLLLTAHYRETFNFTMDGLTGARTALARIDECVGKLRTLSGGAATNASPELISRFTAALDDDFNISAAWAAVFDWRRETNKRIAKNSLTPLEAASALNAWESINSVLGIGATAEAEAPPEIVALLAARQTARQVRDFKRSDEIRDELKAKGWVVEDSPKGPKLKKL
ncbi:MAG: cysteine--tRNA ligase, partial [Verrucomicrobia bacterium]|nr:cysteine--tRNA ligase [Verrucomicrobiota bacterium]